jgi:single-strand DNA-binding protein
VKKVGDTTLAKFSVAVSRYVGKGKPKETDWFDVSVWGVMGDNCAQYLGKGSTVCVIGEPCFREYVGKTDGVKKKAFEVRASRVDFLSRRAESAPEKPEVSSGFIAESFAKVEEVSVEDADAPF